MREPAKSLGFEPVPVKQQGSERSSGKRASLRSRRNGGSGAGVSSTPPLPTARSALQRVAILTGERGLSKIPSGVPFLSPRRNSLLDTSLLFLVPRAAALLIRLIRAATRIRRENAGAIQEVESRGGPYILAFWHSRLFLMPYAYPGRRIAILISEHRDGEFISRTMNRFGFLTARGSTTRGGAAGLREIVRKIRSGCDAAFTPDGPRGPARIVQPGVITAARLTGAPIIPVTFSCSKKNFSRHGTGSCSPCPSGGGFSYTASPSA